MTVNTRLARNSEYNWQAINARYNMCNSVAYMWCADDIRVWVIGWGGRGAGGVMVGCWWGAGGVLVGLTALVGLVGLAVGLVAPALVVAVAVVVVVVVSHRPTPPPTKPPPPGEVLVG